MKKKLIEAIEQFGYPVHLQGSIEPEDYQPEGFFTFWCFDAPEPSHYDNGPTSCDWGFWVYHYGADPERVAKAIEDARKALRESGFVVSGRPTDARSGMKGYTGLMIEAHYLETYRKEV